jgi:serine/threonine-protein kinase
VLTISKTDATVPDVSMLDIETAKGRLRAKGLSNVAVIPDYRDDVDSGTAIRTNPAAFLRARKADVLQVFVAADPHVHVPNVVGVDQASATSQLQALGLDVEVQNATSKTRPAGEVLKASPSSGQTLVRGDTVTLTVSSGPKMVTVPDVRGADRHDAAGELEDRGFHVAFVSVAATADQVDTVIGQDPVGGPVAEGSTITLTVGVKAKK